MILNVLICATIIVITNFRCLTEFLKMEGTLKKVFKGFILTVSFIMFFYQAKIAVEKLIDPPVIDSTEILNIEDIQPPLITICPLNQWNERKLRKIGYHNKDYFLRGTNDYEHGLISWAPNPNMTYEQQIGDLLKFTEDNLDIFFRKKDGTSSTAINEKRFYPKYGWCFDIVNFTAVGNIDLEIFQNLDAEVFLTDKNLRTRNLVDTSTHWGPSVLMQNNLKGKYLITVELLSNFDPRRPNECVKYADEDYDRYTLYNS